jgi:hypothetical protein
MATTIASTDVGGTGLSTVGTNGQVLTSNGTVLSWQTPSAGTSFSAGTTGFTPNTATTGTVTLAGTLNVANGGTGVTTSTGSGSVVLSTSPTLVTPALGTPSALIGTNITGTASGLSIGGNAATATTATNQSGGTVNATTGTFSSTISASNFSGSSSGTNTGDQTNISGNAATATNVAGSGITGSRGIPKAAMPAGSILQVLQTVKSDIFTSTNTSYVGITGLSVSITPTSSTSKILVSFSLNAGIGGNAGGVQLWRNGSVSGYIGDGAAGRNRVIFNVYNNGDNNSMFGWNGCYLDSPATTSVVTYQIYVACVQGGGTIVVNDDTSQVTGTSYACSGASSITVMEVAQ